MVKAIITSEPYAVVFDPGGKSCLHFILLYLLHLHYCNTIFTNISSSRTQLSVMWKNTFLIYCRLSTSGIEWKLILPCVIMSSSGIKD